MRATIPCKPNYTPRGDLYSWPVWLLMPVASTCCFSTALAQAQAAKERGMEEVVVTAQKREERLQEVPIAISVLSGADLDGASVQGVADAVIGVPGVANLVMSRGGNTSTWVIRGVTTAGSILGGTSPIGYYLDSIPFGLVKSSPAPDASPYDLSRVEVLRGPQGTLYGVSSTNGVVRILTQDADLTDFELKGRAAASSTERGGESYRGDLAVNVPLVEGKLAARAVLGYQDVGGWIDKANDKDANDGRIKTGRLKLNAQLTDAFSIGVSAWFSRGDYGAPPLSADGRQSPSVRPEPSATDYDAYSAKLDYQFSSVSLTSATSYLQYSTDWLFDFDTYLGGGVPGYFATEGGGNLFAEEINLGSKHAGPWQWTAGGIYRNVKEPYFQSFIPFNPVLGDDTFRSESFAIFGELKRIFLDGRFDVTAGLRYFDDRVTDRDLVGESSQTNHFDATSPRVVLAWHPSGQTTVYGSYGEGFRSGLNQQGAIQRDYPSLQPAKPDKLRNYEIGAKSNLLDGRASIEAAVFFMDWQDVQQLLAKGVRGNDGSELFVPTFANAGSASGMGIDLAATVVPVNDLTLSVSVGWNDLTVDEDFLSGGIVQFAKGDRLSTSPETTGSLSVDYTAALGRSGLTGHFSTSATYVSKQSGRFVLGPELVIKDGDDIFLTRLGIAVESRERWTATLFADNLFNNNNVILRDLFLASWDTRLRPRTIGLQIEYRY